MVSRESLLRGETDGITSAFGGIHVGDDIGVLLLDCVTEIDPRTPNVGLDLEIREHGIPYPRRGFSAVLVAHISSHSLMPCILCTNSPLGVPIHFPGRSVRHHRASSHWKSSSRNPEVPVLETTSHAEHSQRRSQFR